jgi:hypothetical protein
VDRCLLARAGDAGRRRDGYGEGGATRRSTDRVRCALLALPLSRNGGYLVSHLHPVYRMRRDLRMRRHRPSATTAVIPPPRYLGLGDCEFLIIIFSYFSSSVYYRIRVFFMCVRASWC